MMQLTYQERKVFLFLGLVMAVGFGVVALRKNAASVTCFPSGYLTRAQARRVDVNTATRAELVSVPGIGPKTAQAILDYRARQGAFGRLEDLKAVKGIKEARLARMRKYLSVGK